MKTLNLKTQLQLLLTGIFIILLITLLADELKNNVIG